MIQIDDTEGSSCSRDFKFGNSPQLDVLLPTSFNIDRVLEDTSSTIIGLNVRSGDHWICIFLWLCKSEKLIRPIDLETSSDDLQL